MVPPLQKAMALSSISFYRKIGSTVVTILHRTTRTRNCASHATFLGVAFKLMKDGAKTWRRIRRAEQIGLLLNGQPFKDGAPTQNDPKNQQKLAA